MKTTQDLFMKMISPEHLFQCWNDFKRGKHKRKDIQYFERDLEDNIFQLHEELKTQQYEHLPYEHFCVTDPKQRFISKATVRDRLVHHMVFNELSDIFDNQFIHLSLSCRKGKGIHFGIRHLQRMIKMISANGTKPCYALKMDIKRFFDTINHKILKALIRKRVYDDKVLKIIDSIIDSFTKNEKNTGIPLGNVTSQLFANVYLHVLDDFIKQTLREKYYLRYSDDFIILSSEEHHLKSLIILIREHLKNTLKLELHPNKIIIRKLNQGIDFIGYVLFSKHILLRARTKQRMKKRLQKTHESYLEESLDGATFDQRLQSYLGILSHANENTLATALKNAFWVRDKPS
jgi:retron-type reverse transcriptase